MFPPQKVPNAALDWSHAANPELQLYVPGLQVVPHEFPGITPPHVPPVPAPPAPPRCPPPAPPAKLPAAPPLPAPPVPLPPLDIMCPEPPPTELLAAPPNPADPIAPLPPGAVPALPPTPLPPAAGPPAMLPAPPPIEFPAAPPGRAAAPPPVDVAPATPAAPVLPPGPPSGSKIVRVGHPITKGTSRMAQTSRVGFISKCSAVSRLLLCPFSWSRPAHKVPKGTTRRTALAPSRQFRALVFQGGNARHGEPPPACGKTAISGRPDPGPSSGREKIFGLM